MLSIGSTQGSVRSPLLYCLSAHHCNPAHKSNMIIMFADDNVVVGLISRGDKNAYRVEVLMLRGWCSESNVIMSTKKTSELIIDFRKHNTNPVPLLHQRWTGGEGPILQVSGFPQGPHLCWHLLIRECHLHYQQWILFPREYSISTT